MRRSENLEGLEPITEIEASGLPTPVSSDRFSDGLTINIRGRRIHLRGLKRRPKGLWRLLFILGPGLIATSAGNDAGGIATYSSAGAKFGYQMIWVMVLLTISFAVVQEMCTRLGAATGRGLLDLIRERFGIGWSLFIVAVILIANGGVTLSEFVGIGAAADLLGISPLIAVPAAAVLLWYLVIFGSYAKVEKIFLVMTLVFFAYPVAAFLGHPDWKAVAHGAFIPKIEWNSDYIFLFVGILGTTITPYIQIFQQSSIVERGAARKHYGDERIDAYVGSLFSNIMSIAMIIATAATLYVAGKHEIESAADAAKALEPVVGSSAKIILAVGLLGASLLAGAVLPLATSYAVSEAFGIPKGVNLDFRRGKIFFSIFTALIVIGAGISLLPNLPIFSLLVGVQVLNGVLLPVVLVFILLLVNDKKLMGNLKNSPNYNFFGWATFAMITLAVMVMLIGQLLDLFGIKLFGS